MWLQLLTRGGHLWEFPTRKKLGVLDTAVGGHLWTVVTHGGLTAVLKN